MKGLLIGGGVILSIILGFLPNGIAKPKPFWWRALTMFSMVAVIVLTFCVPTGGNFIPGSMLGKARPSAKIPIRGTLDTVTALGVTMTDQLGRTENVMYAPGFRPMELKTGQDVILDLRFDDTTKRFTATGILSINPWFSIPLVPALEERARNLYLHVPTAWMAQLAWFVACLYAILYLRKRRPEDDFKAVAAASAGALFCVLATITGAIWAKFNWGVFWNWDPRQTSIFVVLIIYGAFFSLRSAIAEPEQRARISSIYLAYLTLPVLFFLFVMPRMMEGLHPGSSNDVNIGPVLSAKEDALAPIKQAIFGLSMFSFTMLFFWMVNVLSRTYILEWKLNMKKLSGAVATETVSINNIRATNDNVHT